MDKTGIEILRVLGYPLGSALVLIFVAYIMRQFFQKLLESVVSRDLESVKNQNAKALEEIRKEHTLAIEDRKADLAKETERLKAALSVEAETNRMVAQKRFDALLELWQATESLLDKTDFSDEHSIRASLESVDRALSNLNKCSVLISNELLDNVRNYLTEIATVLTSTEKEIKEKAVDPEKEKKIAAAISAVLGNIPVVGVFSALLPMESIVRSGQEMLEQFRHQRAREARVSFENALREEFGIQREPERPTFPLESTETEKSQG